jgi:hypothetical protein
MLGRNPAIQSVEYFPKGSLGKTEELSTFCEEIYASHLIALKEPSLLQLCENPAAESYRFLWLRTFHPAVSVRIEPSADGTGDVITKIGNSKSGFGAGSLRSQKRRKLTENEIGLFLAKLRFSNILQEPALEDVLALDGASWVFEAVKEGKYKIVDRHSPKDGPVRQIGLAMMIKFAKLKLLYQDVY